jgi:two-component system response regulator VanR
LLNNNQGAFGMDGLDKMTLLYAEDEHETLKVHKEYFENYFKIVYTASDGKQALKLYRDKKPDVVVLDINMPIISGLEASREIRKYDKETQLVLLTARIDKAALMESMELGLTAYLEKPITRKPMQEALAKISTAFLNRSISKLRHSNKEFYN